MIKKTKAALTNNHNYPFYSIVVDLKAFLFNMNTMILKQWNANTEILFTNTSPFMIQGYHAVSMGRFIFLIEYLVEVTGTLPSISPLNHTIDK